MKELIFMFFRFVWKDDGCSWILFCVYIDDEIYQCELECLFYNGYWCYVGLEVEIFNVGDFKCMVVGECLVIVMCMLDGLIVVVENVCVYCGVCFCCEKFGNCKDFICLYYQWNYDLKGNLIGVLFWCGVKLEGKVQGGMFVDFDLKEYGFMQFNVVVCNGVIFVLFDYDLLLLEDFLGLIIFGYFDCVFDGCKLKILGYNKQCILGNWKLMQENIKDLYYLGFLYMWFVMFGLWCVDNKFELKMDVLYCYVVMIFMCGIGGKSVVISGVISFKEKMMLYDDCFFDVVQEFWWGGLMVVMMIVFLSVIIQQQVNLVFMWYIQFNGYGLFDFVWIYFGFEDDIEEMMQCCLCQVNLFGLVGFVLVDDGEVIEFLQEGFEQKFGYCIVVELGGCEVGDIDYMVMEMFIWGMYEYWCKVMEI